MKKDAVLKTLLSMLMHTPDKKVYRDDVDGLTVSTVETFDAGYETAIVDKDNNAHVVEHYPSEAHAILGHAKWKKQIVGMTEVTALRPPDMELPSYKVKLKRRLIL